MNIEQIRDVLVISGVPYVDGRRWSQLLTMSSNNKENGFDQGVRKRRSSASKIVKRVWQFNDMKFFIVWW